MGNQKSKTPKCNLTVPKADLDVIYANTELDAKNPAAATEILEMYHEFKDEAPNDRLTRDQFVQIYRKHVLKKEPSTKFSNDLYRFFDPQKKGYLSFTDYVMARKIFSGGTEKEKLMYLFKMYDIDKNGVVDKKEMQTVMGTLEEMMGYTGTPKADDVFAKIDADKNGKITVNEFITACMQNSQISTVLSMKPQ